MGRGQGIYRQWKKWPTRRESDRKVSTGSAPRTVRATGEPIVERTYRAGGLVAMVRIEGRHACLAYSVDGTLLGPSNPVTEPTVTCTITEPGRAAPTMRGGR